MKNIADRTTTAIHAVVLLLLVSGCAPGADEVADKLSWIKYLIVLAPIAGAALLKYTTSQLVQYRRFKDKCIKVTATVVAVDHHYDECDMYTPIYSYSHNGKNHKNTSHISSSKKPSENSTIQLEIDPRDPDVFAETSVFFMFAMYFSPIMAFGMFAGGVFFTILLFLGYWPKQ